MGQDFSSGSPLLPMLQAAWDLSVNNETFSCFNQMQFCKRFLWFSKSIKNDICSALTLIRSSTEHKHWKLLVGEEDIKIPQPLWARLKNSVTLCSASLELCHLTCLEFSLHADLGQLQAAAETKHIYLSRCASRLLHWAVSQSLNRTTSLSAVRAAKPGGGDFELFGKVFSLSLLETESKSSTGCSIPTTKVLPLLLRFKLLPQLRNRNKQIEKQKLCDARCLVIC